MKKFVWAFLIGVLILLGVAFQSALEPRVASLELTAKAHNKRLNDLEIVTGLLTPITPTIEFRTPVALTKTPTSEPDPDCRIVNVTSGLNIRVTAITFARKIGLVPYNQKVIIWQDDYLKDYRDSNGYEWALIVYNGIEGYVAIADKAGKQYLRRC